MNNFINKIFIGYMAGLISACVLQSLRVVIFDGGISLTDDFKFNLYRLMIWGGVWAILFIVPFCKNIIVRGFIIGIIVIMFNFMIKMPLAGLGFFGINAPASMILGNIFFNVLWGILAGIIYFLVIIRKNNNSKS